MHLMIAIRRREINHMPRCPIATFCHVPYYLIPTLHVAKIDPGAESCTKDFEAGTRNQEALVGHYVSNTHNITGGLAPRLQEEGGETGSGHDGGRGSGLLGNGLESRLVTACDSDSEDLTASSEVEVAESPSSVLVASPASEVAELMAERIEDVTSPALEVRELRTPPEVVRVRTMVLPSVVKVVTRAPAPPAPPRVVVPVVVAASPSLLVVVVV